MAKTVKRKRVTPTSATLRSIERWRRRAKKAEQEVARQTAINNAMKEEIREAKAELARLVRKAEMLTPTPKPVPHATPRTYTRPVGG